MLKKKDAETKPTQHMLFYHALRKHKTHGMLHNSNVICYYTITYVLPPLVEKIEHQKKLKELTIELIATMNIFYFMK